MTYVTNLNPYKAISFNHLAITKALKAAGSLIVQTKYDGLRCLLVVTPCEDIQGLPAARLQAFSRTTKLIPSLVNLYTDNYSKIALGKLLSESLYPEGLVIDGEALVKGVSFDVGSGILRRKEQLKVSALEYMLYGVVPLKDLLEDKDKEIPVSNCVMQLQTEVLFHQLKEFLPDLSVYLADSTEVFHMAELDVLYKEKRDAGFEGLVVKDPLGKWKRSKKTGWWKVKPEGEIDGIVQDVNWGTEGLGNEGQIIGFQVLLENEILVDANNITKSQMIEFTELYKEDNEIFNGRPVQVKYMEKTTAGSLRHPSFQRWRDLEGSEGVKA